MNMEIKQDPISTEDGKQKRMEEKAFKLDLQILKREHPLVHAEYESLLLKEKIRLANENNGKPIFLSIEQRKEVLEQAWSKAVNPDVDINEMEASWEKVSRGEKGPWWDD